MTEEKKNDPQNLNDLEAYDFWRETQFFNLAESIKNYCQEFNPILLNNRSSISDIIEVLMRYLECENKFIPIEDELSDEEDNINIYDK